MKSRLAAFLAPQSVALVGCPSDLSRSGARVLVFLQKHAYAGRVYPVNSQHGTIGGLTAYPTLTDLPERPDVVWIGVPGPEVEPVLTEAARLQIPGAIVLTAGLAETDAAGRKRESNA